MFHFVVTSDAMYILAICTLIHSEYIVKEDLIPIQHFQLKHFLREIILQFHMFRLSSSNFKCAQICKVVSNS